MFLNILRISASNVLKTFLNIIVSIGFAVVIFNSYKTNRNHKYNFFELAATLAGKKEIEY